MSIRTYIAAALFACGSFTGALAQDAGIKPVRASLDVSLTVLSAAKSREFYGDILGLKELVAITAPGAETIYPFAVGPSVLRLVVYPRTPPRPPSGGEGTMGFTALTLTVPDLDAVATMMAARGYRRPMVRRGRVWTATVRDPDGNVLDLRSPAPGLAARPKPEISAVSVLAGDVKGVTAFYAALGLDVVTAGAAGEETLFRSGTTRVIISAANANSLKGPTKPDEATGIRAVTLRVRDLEEAERALKALKTRGSDLTSPIAERAGGVKSLYVTDPDGNWFEVAASSK